MKKTFSFLLAALMALCVLAVPGVPVKAANVPEILPTPAPVNHVKRIGAGGVRRTQTYYFRKIYIYKSKNPCYNKLWFYYRSFKRCILF